MCTREEKQAQIPHQMMVKIQRLENELQISTAGAKIKIKRQEVNRRVLPRASQCFHHLPAASGVTALNFKSNARSCCPAVARGRMRCCPPATEPRVQNSGGGFSGHPQERRTKGKAGSVFLAEGLRRSSAPACRCRDPAAHRLPLCFALSFQRYEGSGAATGTAVAPPAVAGQLLQLKRDQKRSPNYSQCGSEK